MKRHLIAVRTITLVVISTILFSGCTSTTMIQSVPSGAKLYVDDEPVGNTPYTIQDLKIVGTRTNLKLVMEGYEDLNTSIYRNEQLDVGALIGGIFVTFPFLWILEYKPVHTYELTPVK